VKNILSLLFVLLSLHGFSQRFAWELFAGTANYQGDLQEKRLTFESSRFAAGVGASYMLTDRLSGRAMFSWGKISADDKNNTDPMLVDRNLNFTSSIFELSMVGQLHLFKTLDSRFNPYLMGGIAVFHFDPYTFDTLGTKYYLKPLSTEGQGLSRYPDKTPYSLTQISLPFGAGIKFSVTEALSIGWEIGARKTFTDYLDDVSGRYADFNTLLTAKGPKAVELAYRSGELKTGGSPYPVEGTIRGGSKYKDWYYYSGLTVTYRLIPYSELTYNGKKGATTECPKSVY
jgi:opacity protein-like surface antigen